MSDIALLIHKLNSSLGFHIPSSKVEYLEDAASQGAKPLVEAILYIEGLDREDDVRPAVQAAADDFFFAKLQQATSSNRPRETITLKWKSRLRAKRT